MSFEDEGPSCQRLDDCSPRAQILPPALPQQGSAVHRDLLSLALPGEKIIMLGSAALSDPAAVPIQGLGMYQSEDSFGGE